MRIIAGEHKGRRLLGPKGSVTRPITDRVKTALFSILGPAVEDAVVVDLFAGTGSIGLEALSRGARSCCFAERERTAIERLRSNIDLLGLGGRCRIWRGDVFARLRGWLGELAEPVDLAFVDPPYDLVAGPPWQAAGAKIFDPLAEKLAPQGRVVFRCRRNIPTPEALGLLCVRERRDYGRMSLLMLGRQGLTADAGQDQGQPGESQ